VKSQKTLVIFLNIKEEDAVTFSPVTVRWENPPEFNMAAWPTFHDLEKAACRTRITSNIQLKTWDISIKPKT
jgi:hypothetical protein